MSAIGPGDFVECFKTEFPSSPRLGKIFQCAAVKATPRCADSHGKCGAIWLVGDNTPAEGWALCCFRPIYRPKQSLIEDLSRPVDPASIPAEPQREDA